MPSPCINGGVAWDNSVGLIDADEGHDTYAYNLSTGLGRADSVGWGLFIDEGGDDLYQTKKGLGRSSEHGVSAFFDLTGQDTYDIPQESVTRADLRPSDGKTIRYPDGGLFVDR